MNAIVDYGSSDECHSDNEPDHLQDVPQICASPHARDPMSSSPQAVDYFNLEVSEDEFFTENVNETPSEANNVVTEKIQRIPCEDWTKFTNLSQRNNFSNLCDDSESLESAKRIKLSRPEHSIVSNEAHEPSNVKCFIVHDKIKPRLHSYDKIVNRIPRKKIIELDGHRSGVCRIYWCCPQFSHLLLSCSLDSTVKVWNVFSKSGGCTRLINAHHKGVKDAVWSSSARLVISGGFDGTACASDVETGGETYRCLHQSGVSCLKIHPADPNLFLTGCKDIALAWDLRDNSKPARRFTYKDKFGQVLDMCFTSATGDRFLASNDLVTRDTADRNIMVWDFSTSAVLSTQIFQERYTCTRLCVHPTESRFIAQTQGNYIALFNLQPPYRLDKCKRFEGHKVCGYDVGCDISPDGKLVCSGSADGQMSFYQFQLAKPLSRLQVDDGADPVLGVVWHPLLYSTVACSTWSGKIQVYQ